MDTRADRTICVFSDSHGCARHMLEAVERETPELCIFLGDGERELAALRSAFPALAVRAVRGNCDYGSELPERFCLDLGGLRVFAVHGHQYKVKYDPSLLNLRYAALEAGADAALFGHTHRPRVERSGGLLLLNPGSIGERGRASYGLLLCRGGEWDAEIRYA